MRKRVSVCAVLAVVSSLFAADDARAAWPVLSSDEVQKFVETFPGMYGQYVDLGLRVNPQNGKVNGAWRLKRDEAVKRILTENGWNFMFWPRLQTIVRGYSLAKYEQAVSEHGDDIEKFVDDLKKSPWMTPEKKAELEAFYRQLKTNFASRAKTLRSQVHVNDLKLIKAAIPELDLVMQEVIRIEWEHALAKIGKRKKTG